MSITGTLLLGLIIAVLARSMLPGKQRLGWPLACGLGVAGSVIANYGGLSMGWYKSGEVTGWLVSVLGAVVLLVVASLVRDKMAR